MNKQELIGDYKRISNFCETVSVNKVIQELEQLAEPQKVQVPQFVAEWIEECKNDDFHLFGAMEGISSNRKKLDYWFREDDNMELFARAWLDGYTVEKEKRYRVRFKGLDKDLEYLNFKHGHVWVFSDNIENEEYRTHHTRKELEEAGFGEVFKSPLFEVEEVE